MTKLKSVLIALFLLCCAAATAEAQTSINQEKEQAIRHLLNLTKAGDVAQQMIDDVLPQVRASFAGLPEEVRDKIMRVYEEEMRKEFTPEKMIASIVPVYDKYLTLEEVKQLSAFYETPVGQKLITVLPLITREAFEDGMARGRQTGQRVLARLRSEGVFNPEQQSAPKAQSSRQPAARRPRRRP